jgi:hypothetical protein
LWKEKRLGLQGTCTHWVSRGARPRGVTVARKGWWRWPNLETKRSRDETITFSLPFPSTIALNNKSAMSLFSVTPHPCVEWSRGQVKNVCLCVFIRNWLKKLRVDSQLLRHQRSQSSQRSQSYKFLSFGHSATI